MAAVLLALAASLSWGFADFGGGVVSRRVAVPAVIVGTQASGLALAGAIILATGADAPSWRYVLYGMAAGVVGVTALYAFYRGLAIGAMGVVAPITTTGVLVPVAVGLFRGERPSGLQGVGVVLALVGIVAASLEPEREALHDRRLAAGAGLALIAALGFGAALVGIQAASKGGGALWATATMRMASLPLVIAVALAVRPPTAGLRRAWPLVVLVGLLDTGANLLFGEAATRGLLSVTSVLSSLYPVIVVLLARFLLAERLAPVQLAGAATALAGVALISAG
jgi:drug/metabolite transporter (DMT)-like permease